MSKRKRKQNIEKMIKEGYGSGIGSEYKPWIKIQDVPSLGRVTRVKGIKTNRQHELLSDMERNYFYILEYSDNVKDIREQFPLLPQEDTISIADELGLRHPKDPETGEDIVMTTDFLITVSIEDGIKEVARTIKSKDDLLDKRILEKFEIERVFWKKRNIDWAIVTEEEIDKTIAHNISFIQGYCDIKNVDGFTELDSLEIQDLVYEFIRRIVDYKRSMRSICLEFDNDMSLESGCGLSIFKYLVINKIIEKINIIHKKITNDNEKIDIIYTSCCENKKNYMDLLTQRRKLDIIKGYTTKGIHRDDFEVYINDKELSMYGSQGQNRTAVLSLKLSELQVIHDEIEEEPILLLDDFMSELDIKRRRNFLNNINNTQVIITCAEKINFINENVDYYLYQVKKGEII